MNYKLNFIIITFFILTTNFTSLLKNLCEKYKPNCNYNIKKYVNKT